MICFGKNKEDNWRLLEHASPDDLWFHVVDFPSAYVFLSESHFKKDIRACVTLCKSRSKARHQTNVRVVCTPVGNIMKGRVVGEAVIIDPKLCRVYHA